MAVRSVPASKRYTPKAASTVVDVRAEVERLVALARLAQADESALVSDVPFDTDAVGATEAWWCARTEADGTCGDGPMGSPNRWRRACAMRITGRHADNFRHLWPDEETGASP
ncbi:MAG: hypothetical protein IPM45_15605 [Acidimicrobiales bacterium]|nr:hypothetical protein [Acidimicrobiales bacterium]